MSTIDLIILGILLKSPMNAYELTRFIDDGEVGRLLKISKPAIYKSCKRLFNAGYLNGEKVREGEMPEKMIYSLNQKGQDRFYDLMAHFSGNVAPFYFDFNCFLWNIDKLGEKKGLEIIIADEGIPFNPLSVPEPDVHVPIEERMIGGLGIFMIRKLADDVTYERDGNRNVLTLVKYV